MSIIIGYAMALTVSISRTRCTHLMAVAVFLRIMRAKITATIASYRSTLGSEYEKRGTKFLSFCFRECQQLCCLYANAHYIACLLMCRLNFSN